MAGDTIDYLTLAELLAIHNSAIELYGGSTGVRDMGLLESAAATPQAAFFGEDAYPTITAKAAAYAFHLCKNHPFIDGNKRVAAMAASVFLRMNGYHLTATSVQLADTILAVAEGSMDKVALTQWLERFTTRP